MGTLLEGKHEDLSSQHQYKKQSTKECTCNCSSRDTVGDGDLKLAGWLANTIPSVNYRELKILSQKQGRGLGRGLLH